MTTTAFFEPTDTSFSEASWTLPANIKVDDDSSATATCSRTLNYPVGYSTQGTGILSARTFTGILAGISNGDRVDGIEVVVRAKASRVDTDIDLSVQIYDAVETQRLTADFVEYTFGGATTQWTDNPILQMIYAFANGALISAAMTSGNGEATVTIEFVKMRLYWSDVHCDALTFNTVAAQPLDTWIYSNVVTVAGMPGGHQAFTYFLGGWSWRDNSFTPRLPTWHAAQMSINGGKWYSELYGAYVQNGDTIQLRRKEDKAIVVDTWDDGSPVFIGGLEFTWTVTTVAVDNTITAPPIDRTVIVPRNSKVKIATYFVDGTNTWSASSPYAFNDATYVWFASGDPAPTFQQVTPTLLGGDRYALDQLPEETDEFVWEVFNGDYVECSITPPATYGTQTGITAYVGPAYGVVYAVTVAETIIPTQVHWASPAAVATTTVTTTAAAVTIAGLDVATTTPVTFTTSGGSAHEFQKNGGAWTAVGGGSTAANGDTFKVRMTSPGAGSQSGNIVMKIGGGTGMHCAFTIVTTGGDVTPSAFTFTDVTGAIPGLLYTSNAQVLAGVTAAQPILATVSPGFQIRVGAGAWTDSSLSVANGDSITIRGYAPLQAGTTKSCVVTIGGTQDTWTLTSRAASAFWD